MGAAGVLHQEPHRRRQQRLRLGGEAGHAFVEPAGDLRGQAARGQPQLAAQDAQLGPVRAHRGERRHQAVVLRQGGIEPAQAGEPRGIVVAVRRGGGRVHADRQRHLLGAAVPGADRQRAAVDAGHGVGGHRQAHPQRLHAALGHVQAGRERPAGVVDAAEVEAGQGRGGDARAARPLKIREARLHVRGRRPRCPQADLEAQVLAAQGMVGQRAAGAALRPASGDGVEHAHRVGAGLGEQQPRRAGMGGQQPRQFVRRGRALHVGVGVEVVHRLVAEHGGLRGGGQLAGIVDAAAAAPLRVAGVGGARVGHAGVVGRAAGQVGLVVDRVDAGAGGLEGQLALGLSDAQRHHVAHHLAVRPDHDQRDLLRVGVAAAPGQRRAHQRGRMVHAHRVAVVAQPGGVPAQRDGSGLGQDRGRAHQGGRRPGCRQPSLRHRPFPCGCRKDE